MIYEYEPQTSRMAAERNRIRGILNNVISHGDQGVETMRAKKLFSSKTS